MPHFFLFLITGFLSQGLFAQVGETYEREWLTWREKRVERLRAADGWLTLVGREWLQEGEHSLGRGPGVELRLPAGPERLGVLIVNTQRREVKLRLEVPGAATVDGEQRTETLLRHDGEGTPSLVKVGTATFVIILRGGRLALRVRDEESAARRGFTQIDCFPLDLSWRLVARWEPFEPGRKVQVENVIGQISEEEVPGRAVFEHQGRSYALLPTQEKPGAPLFFVFRDLTSGQETYGASRFLYAEAPKDAKVVLDFNRAYNPPCAFTEHATCPLPIPENRLPLAIRAGEKAYCGPLATQP